MPSNKQSFVGLNTKTYLAFLITIHALIFANAFWELFAWLNQWWIDPSYQDPIILPWIFWFIESIIVIYLLSRKFPLTNV